MSNLLYQLRGWASVLAAACLVGCSIHPIPDDVSRYATEDIVRNVRCEAKAGVRERIAQGLQEYGLHGIVPDTVLENKADFAEISRRAPVLAKKFLAYGASNIVYAFDFKITENNDKTGSGTFHIPFAKGGSFTLGLDGGVTRKRMGTRTFTTEEKFRDLVKLDCRGWIQPDRNMLYPLTGSIGVDRVIRTFIAVSEIGGGAADYSDEITFTTHLSSTINPTLVMTPVTDRFRLINANAEIKNGRLDVHQVTITISFPDLKEVGISASEMSRDTRLRALENSCIAINRGREDRFGTLRLTAPEDYCRQGAASFQ